MDNPSIKKVLDEWFKNVSKKYQHHLCHRIWDPKYLQKETCLDCQAEEVPCDGRS